MREVLNITEKNQKEVVAFVDNSKYFNLHNSGTRRSDLFNFAIALGVKRGYANELTTKKTSFVRTEYLENSNCKYLYSSLYFSDAIADAPSEKIDHITDDNAILDLAERYANTGFDVLKEYFESLSDEELAYTLISEMDDEYERIFGDQD